MLSLVSGRYPATATQVAVTGGVAAAYHLRVGGDWTVAGRTWTVTGTVQNPQSLLDEFALVIPVRSPPPAAPSCSTPPARPRTACSAAPA